MILGVFDSSGDRGSTDGRKTFVAVFDTRKNSEETNAKLIYLDSRSFLLFLSPPLSL